MSDNATPEATKPAATAKAVADVDHLKGTDAIEIAHKDGRTYGVTVKDYKATFAEQGFRATRMGDGSPLVKPEKAKS